MEAALLRSEAGDAGPLPVTHGRLLDFPDDPVTCMRRLYRAHGDIAALEEDGQRVVFVFSPRYNQEVLSDTTRFHARFFAVRGPRQSAQRRLTSGLLSMNGDEHKRHRRLVMGPFQKKSIVRYRDALVEHADRLVRGWEVGHVKDISREMNQYMLRVTSTLLFGFDQPELAYEIGRMTERWVGMNHEIGMGALVADQGISSAYCRLLEQADALEVLIRRMIDLRRRSSELADDVLSLLLRARDEDGTGMTDAELIGQAAVLFGAAHLTTAHTLTWTLFLLAQHPRVARELVEELRGELAGGPPALEQLERLPVLDRVVKESMRVLPSSSYSQRVTAEALELGPFALPRGTPIVFSQFMTHHRADLFREPERFLPERWETIAPPPYGYIPFAAGPRLCLGAALAMMTIKTTLPAIVQNFRLETVPGARINGKVISTMLGPTSGMPMRLLPSTAPYAASWVEGNIHELVELPRDAEPVTVPARAA
jgi:cytochrome P450